MIQSIAYSQIEIHVKTTMPLSSSLDHNEIKILRMTPAQSKKKDLIMKKISSHSKNKKNSIRRKTTSYFMICLNRITKKLLVGRYTRYYRAQ